MNAESVKEVTRHRSDSEILSDARERMLGRFECCFPGGVPDVLEAAVCAALGPLEQSRLMSLMDEEASTSALLGALVASSSVAAAVFAPANGEALSRSLNWADYHKSASKDDWGSESKNGADFTLIVRLTRHKARLAVFQAKRAETTAPAVNIIKRQPSATPTLASFAQIYFGAKEAYLDVHRRPPRRGQLLGQWRKAQMAKLFEMGRDVQRARMLIEMARPHQIVRSLLSDSRRPFPRVITLLRTAREKFLKHGKEPKAGDEEKSISSNLRVQKYYEQVATVKKRRSEAREELKVLLSQNNNDPSLDLSQMTWIHYLAYLSESASDRLGESAVAIPLAELAEWLELENKETADSPNYIDLAEVKCRAFSDLLLRGVGSNAAPEEGWLQVDEAVVKIMLPRLQELGPVVFLHTQEALRPEPTFTPSPDLRASVTANEKPDSASVGDKPEIVIGSPPDKFVTRMQEEGAAPIDAEPARENMPDVSAQPDTLKAPKRQRDRRLLKPSSKGPGGKPK